MTDDESAVACAACRFHRGADCRRLPPQVVPVEFYTNRDGEQRIATRTAWPQTNDDEWCGEFRPRTT